VTGTDSLLESATGPTHCVAHRGPSKGVSGPATPFKALDTGFALFETQPRLWHADQRRGILTGAGNILLGAINRLNGTSQLIKLA
jgi:hypothetical protein